MSKKEDQENMRRNMLIGTLMVVMTTVALHLMQGTARAWIHHDLKVVLDPKGNRIAAEDTVRLTGPQSADKAGRIRFKLLEGLEPRIVYPEKGPSLTQEGPGTYVVYLPGGLETFTLRYEGKIVHPLRPVGEEQAREQRETEGTISPEGVYLSDASCWYPEMESPEMMTFDLSVEMPAGWDAVSQGRRTDHQRKTDRTITRWACNQPQQAIWLVAGEYSEYSKRAGAILCRAFLREPDPKLAAKYLEATGQYLSMYETLIGPYPYAKFALVENFWETGYGMPSFTLLGPRIIRFPFILSSSYPHEILHNWWGNSVYVDYDTGNWGEGLTAYLSDHLIKQQMGQGSMYRQETLQQYTDYVLTGRDFPLNRFHSRHGSVTQAVGYGKCLMFFHMLRLRLGDECFKRALREFYEHERFKTAGFKDLKRVFEQVSGRDLDREFRQWIDRTGAPELKIGDAGAEPVGEGSHLTLNLLQVQKGPPFAIRVPVAVTLESEEHAFQTVVSMAGREKRVELCLGTRPLRVDVDPEYDVFRRLDRNEMPPAFTQAFGAERVLIVLPAEAEGEMRKAYEALAHFLSRTGPGHVEITKDIVVGDLPTDRSVWVFGWNNRLVPEVEDTLRGYGAGWNNRSVILGDTEIPRKAHSFAITVRHPGNLDLALLWLATDRPEALPGLGRKLPHYHKYSYLGFVGDEPSNVAKGRWPVVNSPLTRFFADENGRRSTVGMGRLKPREPLAMPQATTREEAARLSHTPD